MSLFTRESPQFGWTKYFACTAPTLADSQGGGYWRDATSGSFQNSLFGNILVLHGTVLNITSPITTTYAVSATAQTLASKVFNAGYFKFAGKNITIKGAGTYVNTAGGTPTVAIALKAGSVTLCTLTSTATDTAGVSNFPFQFEFGATVITASAVGTFESWGKMAILLGTSATAASSTFTTANTAVSSTVDLTAAVTLAVTGAISVTGASNAITLRYCTIEVS